VLGLTNSATLEEIKMTYRQLMRQYHPDNSEKQGWDEETRERNIGITKKFMQLIS
jgi:DnaJ-class molecular chaperone